MLMALVICGCAPGGRISGLDRLGQLIALTGALASGRDLMVLDEATANMDNAWVNAMHEIFDKEVFTLITGAHGRGYKCYPTE